MKVILLKDVKKVGKKDQTVEVSDGYARNMIIPKGLGLPASAENLNNLKLKNKNEEKKEEKLRGIANENKEKIESSKIVLFIKAGSNGKTFGSITSKEIAEEVKNALKIDVDKKDVLLDESLKNIGTYDVKIKLHKDIVAILKVEVKDN